jgi:hypothetical protein
MRQNALQDKPKLPGILTIHAKEVHPQGFIANFFASLVITALHSQ